MAMNKQRRTSNINNIVTYDTLKNVTVPANLTVKGITQAGFVKSDGNGLFSVDTTAYQAALPSQTGQGGKFLTTDGSALSWGTVSTANIYTDNGVLTGNRTVGTTNGYTLTINPNTTFNGNIYLNSQNTYLSGGVDFKIYTGNILRTTIYSDGGFFNTSNNTTNGFWVDQLGTGVLFAVAQNSNPKFRVFNNGNVVVGGTLDATYKFDVQGTGRFTNNVTITPVNGGTISLGLSNAMMQLTDNGGYSRFLVYQSGVSNSSTTIGGGNLAAADIRLDSTGVFFGYPSNQNTSETWKFSRPFAGAAGDRKLLTLTTVNNNAFTTTYSLTGIYINPDPQYWARVIALQNTVGDVLLNTTSGSTIIGGTGTSTYKLDVLGTIRATGAITGGDSSSLNNILFDGGGTRRIRPSTNTLDITDSSGNIAYQVGSTYPRISIGFSGVYFVRDLNSMIYTQQASSQTMTVSMGAAYASHLDPYLDIVASGYAANATNKNTTLRIYTTNTTSGVYGNIILSHDGTNKTGNILIGGTTNNSSAIVNIQSTTQGFLPPRMTSAQRSAISTPATGLVVYQTDSSEGIYQYKSTGWEQIGGAVTDTNIYNTSGTLTGHRVIYGGSAWTFTIQDINTFTVDSTSVTNNVAAFKATEPNVVIQAMGASNGAALFLNPSNSGINGSIHNRTGGGLEFYVGSTPTVKQTIKATGQIQFNGYTSTGSFSGTAAGYLGFDSSGNIITTTGTGGITLTTTGSSGAATWDGTTLNIPIYSGGGGGSVTTVSVVSANGFAGTVANATSTPAITLTTTISGILKGNSTSISAATAGLDYQAPITLTTTGSSIAATFSGNTLNIPNYSLSNIYNSNGTLASNRTISAGGFTLAIEPITTFTTAVGLTRSANDLVSININNTNTGIFSSAGYAVSSDSSAGSGTLYKYSSTGSGAGTGTGASDFILSNATAGNLVLKNGSTSGDVRVLTNAGVAMVVNSAGKVLIGTSTAGTSKLRITGLPTSSAGLSSGDVWSNSGVLTIVP